MTAHYLTENDPKHPQPDKIVLSMKPHQQTALARMIQLESNDKNSFETFNANGQPLHNTTINTSLGVLADKVSYGKTLTVLGLISVDPKKHESKENITSTRHQEYINLRGESIHILETHKIYDVEKRPTLPCTLVIAPHGSVFAQWKETIEKHTSLKYFAVCSKKDLTKFCLEFKTQPHSDSSEMCKLETIEIDIQMRNLKAPTKPDFVIKPINPKQTEEGQKMQKLHEQYIEKYNKWSAERDDYWTALNNLQIKKSQIALKFRKQDLENIEKSKSNMVNRKPDYLEFEKNIKSLDILLVSATFATQLTQKHAWTSNFKRIVVDEADSINIPANLYADFLWYVTATFDNIRCLPKGMNSRNTPYIYVKNAEDYLKQSFELDAYEEIVYSAKDPANYGVYQGCLQKSILEAINADDTEQAFMQLGGSSSSQESIVELLTKDMSKKIKNLLKEIDFIESLDLSNNEKKLRIEPLRKSLLSLETQKKGIEERMTGLADQECSICLSEYENPLALTCSHIFCSSCLAYSLNGRSGNCPTCRMSIDANKLIYISKNQNQTEKDLKKQKFQTKLEIVKSIMKKIMANPKAKVLLFSNSFATFDNLHKVLDDLKITHATVSGCGTGMVKTIEKFKNGHIKILMLNSQHNAAGINLECASDVIIYHKLDKATDIQVIGRAQRFGRKCPLTIHRLCYSNEI